MRELIDALNWCSQNQKPCVVATIISVEGPAYQHEGTRCLIHENGTIVGILSGGCVEDELIRQAKIVLETGKNQTIDLDFTDDDDLVLGFGSGCGGKLSIWLEILNFKMEDPQPEILLEELQNRETTPIPYFALTVLSSDNPTKIPPGHRFRVEIAAPPFQLIKDRPASVKCVIDQTMVNIFVEPIYPKPVLLLIGTGKDAILLCESMKTLGWHVELVYHQTERANSTFFPNANRVIYVPRGDFSGLELTKNHYCVIMSHQFDIDLEALRTFISSPVRYIGLLSSKTRKKKMIQLLKEEPDTIDDLLIKEKLYSPIGLNLGAETLEEITLSISAELLSVNRGKNAGFLKGKGEKSDLYKRK